MVKGTTSSFSSAAPSSANRPPSNPCWLTNPVATGVAPSVPATYNQLIHVEEWIHGKILGEKDIFDFFDQLEYEELFGPMIEWDITTEEIKTVSDLPVPPGRSKVMAPSISSPVVDKDDALGTCFISFAPDPKPNPVVIDTTSSAYPLFRQANVNPERYTVGVSGENCANLAPNVRIEATANRYVQKALGTVELGVDEREQRTEKIGIPPNRRINISSWTKGRQLGRGASGYVYEAMDKNGLFFAVKEIFIDQGNKAKKSIIQLEREVSILSCLQHQNIVQYYGTDQKDGKLYIFLELAAKGSLASVYESYPIKDSQASAYTLQILNGLNYLHGLNILHRDVKCANILVDSNGCVKLADFGIAKKISDLTQAKTAERGSFYWMAPEVVNPRGRPYKHPADIWSLGCTVLEMLTGELPYPKTELVTAIYKIGNGERPPIPSTLSDEAYDFIDKCLQVNPENRPSATALLQHPFVTQSSDDANW